MSENSIGKKTLSGFFWSFAEKMLAEIINLAITIVLSRLIMPEAYGTITLMQVFISISIVFVTAGMGASLVQKKDADALDFSSVFTANIVIGLVLYIVLFIISPWVAAFYENESITIMLRVLALRVPFASAYNVQHAYVQRRMEFKKFFFSSLGGTIASGIVGIAMAYWGYGAWALIAATLTDQVVDSLVLFCTTRWIPQFRFSFKRWKPLFKYGNKILISHFISKASDEVYSLTIGKVYSASDLAYNAKGKKVPFMLSESLSSTIMSVMFPALSKLQSNRDEMVAVARRAVRSALFFVAPMMVGFAAAADHIVPFVFSDKWLASVPFFQLYSLTYVLQPVHSINQKLIYSIGKSDKALLIEIIKRVVGLVFLAVSVIVFKSVMVTALCYTMMSLVELIVNSVICGKMFEYGFKNQAIDIAPPVIISLVMGSVVLVIGKMISNHLLAITVQIIAGAVVYVLLAWIFKLDGLRTALSLVKRKR